ncbi:hypothetical protein LTR91_023709 [Friedmanniomyces endolithicus]|uniref:Prefoldin subunit 4 n=2 Tax=Friedmanniomyces endolithicus TaxID=329885 RepID=A0A4U0UII9_9PEZI|nr:hypothetical protein LTS09_010436 [Friedmanniomyces endolithicus]KAK0365185.1 hypothetical protein LTR94_007735 [Friedmanniomyces endolithicus]KAK0772857.1 hypothetical protein LTR38_016760 [Friedmanniomyces endolithicus]KAK0801945.1 hypothetical protein LTR59_005299 [Friedmanniomyces endolithicus]KAK0817357.1 hypothetical protein LTR75_003096 [Friedmanniomyces endolithicus]
MLSKRMLSREEEAQIGEEKEVRREDQEKINRFSRLHSREKGIDEQLKAREASNALNVRAAPPQQVTNAGLQKEKEDLEEISAELELADEDDKVPYRIGDSFFSLPVSEVQDLLSSSVERINGNVESLEEKLSGLRDEMRELKAALYGRFGRSINLEA